MIGGALIGGALAGRPVYAHHRRRSIMSRRLSSLKSPFAGSCAKAIGTAMATQYARSASATEGGARRTLVPPARLRRHRTQNRPLLPNSKVNAHLLEVAGGVCNAKRVEALAHFLQLVQAAVGRAVRRAWLCVTHPNRYFTKGSFTGPARSVSGCFP